MAIKTSAISSAKNAVNRAKTAAEKKKEEEEKRQAQEAKNRKSTDTKANSGKTSVLATAKQAAETAVKRVEAETGQTATKEVKDAVTRAAKKAAKAATEQVKQASKATEKKGLAKDAAKSTFQKISERIAASEPGKQAAATEKGMRNILDRYRFTDDLTARTAQRQENILNNREVLTGTGAAKELLGTDRFLPRWTPYSPTSMTYLPPAYLDQIAKDQSLIAKGFGLGGDKVSYADILAATALDPLSAMKADSKSNAFFGRGAGMKSKPWTEGLTDQEKIKEGINRLAEQQKKERRARSAEQQTLSSYDQKLRDQAQKEIKLAKADFDSAKARGDTPGMVEAHRRAESWRRWDGGYSGGAAGNEYISPKLDNTDISLLNKAGQAQLKAAKLGYENAQSDEERARYAAMGQDIRRNPMYLKPVHDRGAYRETDAEGRMRYAGTAEERQKEGEQLSAIPKAIGTGVAGSFLSIPGTTARALQTDAARNQAALQNLSDIRGGGEVNISAPAPLTTPTLGQRLLNKSDEYREKATEGQKGLDRYLAEALITGGEMIPGLAATALTGGAAAPGLAVMGAQAAGGRMGRLEAAGEDPVRAFNRGVVTGLIEAGTELIPLGNLTRMAKGGGKSFARNILTQAIEEAGTEVASDYLNYAADKAFKDPNATRPTLQDVKDTAIISMLTSLGMGAGAGAIGARRTGRQNTRQAGSQTDTIQQAADNLRQAAADLEAAQARTRAMREQMRTQQSTAAEDPRQRAAELQRQLAEVNAKEQEALASIERNSDSPVIVQAQQERLAGFRQEKDRIRAEAVRLAEQTRGAREAGRELAANWQDRQRADYQARQEAQDRSWAELVNAFQTRESAGTPKTRVQAPKPWVKTPAQEQGPGLYKDSSSSNGKSWRFRAKGQDVMARNGTAMFADNFDRVSPGHYGEEAYSVPHSVLTDIDSLHDEIIREIERGYEYGTLPSDMLNAMDNGTSAEEIANEFNPDDIVDSAKAWDNEDWAQWFWDRILDGKDISGLKTEDGAIVFDPSLISREDAADAWKHQPDIQEPGFSPLQPPRERTAEAPPVTEKETERKHSPGYNTAENHIDNRQTGDVYLGDRNVKAFQWDHPEVKPFFQKAAAALKRDVEYADSTKHSQRASNIQRARGKKAGTVMEKNDVIRKLMDRGLSTTDIIKACDAIINDEGQENYAAAKRVELALDDMLSKGYTPTDSGYKAEDKVAARVAPDAEYLAVKDRIAGAVKQGSWERYLRDNEAMLDWGEVTEDELRAEWEALQAQPQEATEAARPTEPDPRTFASFEEEMADLGSRVNSLVEEWQEARRTRPEDQEAEAYYREQAQQVPVIEQAIREKWGRAETPEPEPTPYARREEPPVREEEQERYSVGAAPGGFDPYSRMLNEYGAIEPGMDTAEGMPEKRFIDVPRSTNGKNFVRRGARTLLESPYTSDETARQIERDIVDDLFSDNRKGLDEMTERAYQVIEEHGTIDALARWEDIVAGRKKPNEDDLAMGAVLYAHMDRIGNTEAASRIAGQLAAELTTAGRMANVSKILKRAMPEDRIFYLRKSLDPIKEQVKKRYASKKKQHKIDEIKLNEDLVEQYRNAGTQEEADATLDQLWQDFANQAPLTVWDRLDAWRYFAMLGNPRTHVRNTLGNFLFGELERASGKLSAGLQHTLPKGQRTRTVMPADKKAREFAKQDYEKVKNTLLRGGKYTDDVGTISQKIRERAMGPFAFNSKLLEWEDAKAKSFVYKRTLAQYLNAKGWDPDNLSTRQLNEARDFAVHNAKVATFTEENIAAKQLARAEQYHPVLRVAVGSLFPFKGVPANMVKQGFVYSPINMLLEARNWKEAVHRDKAMAQIEAELKNVPKEGRERLEKVYEELQKVANEEKSAAEAIDGFSKGLTGTAIATIGFLLAAKGILAVSGSDDDDIAAMEAAEGNQNYSLKINGHTYTIDWAAPTALPLFVGGEFYNGIKSLTGMDDEEDAENIGEENDDEGNEEEALSKTIKVFYAGVNAGSRLFDPLINLTVLQGVSGMTKEITYGGGNASAIGGYIARNFASQFVPTLSGQIARTADDTRRTTFVDKNSDLGPATQRFIQMIENKIPGVSKINLPYLDVWGRESKQDNVLLRALGNFVSPGYLKKVEDSEVDDELNRLGIFPKLPAKNGKVDGNFMTKDQYENRAKTQGKTSLDMLTDAMNSDEYNAMSDEEKAAYVKKIFGYAKEKGKEAAGAEKITEWVSNMDQAAKDNNVEVSALMRACMHIDNTGDADGNGSVKTEEAWNAIQDMDGPEALKRAAFAVYNGTDNTYDEYKADAEEKARKQAEVDKYFSTLSEEAQAKILEACDGNLKNFTQEQAYVTIKGLGLSAAQEKAAYNGINVEAGWVKDGQPRTWESFESTVSKKIQKNGPSEPKEKKETDLSQYFDESELERAEEVNDYIENHGGYFTRLTQWGENMAAMGVPKSEWPTYYKYANARRGKSAWGSSYEKAAKDHGW